MKSMKVKRSRGEQIFSVFNYIFLSLIMLVCLYPVWYVVVASFSDSNMLTQHTGLLLKSAGWSVEAYNKVFKNPMIVKGYLNTLFILVVGVSLDIIMTSLGAYVHYVLFRRNDPILSESEGSSFNGQFMGTDCAVYDQYL